MSHQRYLGTPPGILSGILPGIIFIVGGALLAILPQLILPVCENQITTASGAVIPMKCFWMARAELGVGAFVFIGGLLFFLFRDPGTRIGVAAMIALAALLAVAFSTFLIGVCPSEQMACHMGTKPAVAVIAAVILVAALAACRGQRRLLRGRA